MYTFNCVIIYCILPRSIFKSVMTQKVCITKKFGKLCYRSTKGGRILCLDGGGIRGLVLIVVLRAVQRQAGSAPVKHIFDWIAGTSTGAILALALAMGVWVG